MKIRLDPRRLPLPAFLNEITVLLLASLAAVTVTFLSISGSARMFAPSAERVWLLLIADIALFAMLALVVARRIAKLGAGFRRKLGASKLQQRVVLSFSLVAILPTVIISVASAVFFNLGVQAWFNDRVDTAVGESLAVAEAYLAEHRENIRADALAMSQDIGMFASLAVTDPIEFNRVVSAQAERRQLTEVVIFQRNRIIAQGRLTFTVAFESLPASAVDRAGDGEVVILDGGGGTDKVRALIRIDALPDAYLLVGRLVDAKVISHMENTSGAVNEYLDLKSQLSRLQSSFVVLFVLLTLVLVLATVWYGLVFTARITTPIVKLADAAERVRGGDYDSRVETSGEENEVTALSRTFNRMVEGASALRADLLEANRQIDNRRRFSEAVLGGVSAGVLALDGERRITLANRSAATILGLPQAELQGKLAGEILPGIHELLSQAEGTGEAQGNMNIVQQRAMLTLHVRVTAEKEGSGAIVTFDDITPLAAAQRNAAWSDVARRVAHEIKNPLTPIALSAERLKRKYLKYLEGEDAETFVKYTDTIARHVADIGGMVDEFVAFARMPGAQMKECDLLMIARKVLFSEQVAHTGIRYRLECTESALPLLGDERQLAQVLSNILKNAAEAVESRQTEHPDLQGEIGVSLEKVAEKYVITVRDNGPGFPPEKIQSMLEPYVSTRSRGSGLGLSIVKKIVEEHKGMLQLANAPEGGAIVTLSFLQQCDINAATL